MKKKHLFTIMVFALLLGVPQLVLATDSSMTLFNTLYKTTGTKLNSCSVCHTTKVPALNPYGKAFAAKLSSVAPRAALKQIQKLDSDKDGFTNLVEIKALTFPGKRASKPPKGPDSFAAAETAGSSMSGMTKHQKFTRDFQIDQCTFSSQGSNPYFILEPGYQLVLEGNEGGKNVRLTITVLNETKVVDGVGTRVVEEIATENGNLVEVARNYFAICDRTNSVFYFGEDVDNYVGGQIANHDGSWLAGSNGAKAGVIMPGIVLSGSRYYQEVAPGVALDRAEIVSTTATIQTPAGTFTGCLKTKESTPLDRGVTEFKMYAPQIGLVKDAALKLVSHGFVTP